MKEDADKQAQAEDGAKQADGALDNRAEPAHDPFLPAPGDDMYVRHRFNPYLVGPRS